MFHKFGHILNLKSKRSPFVICANDARHVVAEHCIFCLSCLRFLFEPVHEKNNNLGFRPGPT